MSEPLKIMITGAGGFIGSRLSRYFCAPLSSGDVHLPLSIIFDIIRKKRRKNVGGLSAESAKDNTIHLDLSDHDAVRTVINDICPDIVIHTAAVTSSSVEASSDDYRSQNLENSRALLEALVQAKETNTHYNPAFIFSSSVGVYGAQENETGIVHEGDPLNGQSDYAGSKIEFENVLRAQNNVRYAILRYANIPGKDGFINAVLRNKKVTFYGDDPYVRDYIHLDDLCDLHGAVVRHFVDGGSSLTLNVGSGVGLAFSDIVDEMERQMGTSIARDRQVARENDVVRLICDMQRAKDVLNWQPQKTSLEDIVSYALENSEQNS